MIASVRVSAATVHNPRKVNRVRGSPSRGRAVLRAQPKKFGSFEEMLSGSEVPLLVDFYATWCGPCQMLSPVLAGLSKRMEGKIQVVKIDTEKYPEIASKFSINALPTVMLFKDGKPVDRMEGLLDEQQYFERINYYLAGSKDPSTAPPS